MLFSHLELSLKRSPCPKLLALWCISSQQVTRGCKPWLVTCSQSTATPAVWEHRELLARACGLIHTTVKMLTGLAQRCACEAQWFIFCSYNTNMWAYNKQSRAAETWTHTRAKYMSETRRLETETWKIIVTESGGGFLFGKPHYFRVFAK